jgi:hypothetical protein
MKYESLQKHLALLPKDVREVTLTFDQLEEMLGFKLPKSAVDYRQWWENPSDPTCRPQAQAWIGAGFHVASVALRKPGGWVHFQRV